MNARSVCQTCALALLAANVALAAPVTYYVKNGGNDSKDGLSDGGAWATINRVHIQFNDSGSPITAGDSVLFKCGDEWAEQLIVSKSGNTQVPGGVITIGAYGSGDRPIIGYDVDLTGVTWTQYGATDAYSTSATAEVFIANEYLPSNQLGEAAGYFRLYHRADDEDDCAATAGSFYWDDGSPAKLYIHAFNDSNPNSTPKKFYANTTGWLMLTEADMEANGAIRTNNQSYIVVQNVHAVNQAYGIGGEETDHITIDNCRISGNWLGTKFGFPASYPHSTYLTVHDTDVRYNGNGLTFNYSENITVYDNTVAEHFIKLSGEDREGISFFNCDDVEVYGNELWEMHVGLIVDVGPSVSRNFYFHHNYFHGRIERCIVLGGIGKFDDDVHVYHNVMWLPLEDFDDPTTGETAIPQGIWLTAETVSTSEPFRVYNNTIHAKYGLVMNPVAVQINLDLKNNIFDECRWHILDRDENIDDVDPSHHVRDYNSFDAISADPFHKIMWDGTVYSTWAAYRDPLGRNIEANGNLGDPGFVDPPENVRVQGPLEDVGECPAGGVPFDCATALDFYGQEIGNTVSIGAAEPPV